MYAFYVQLFSNVCKLLQCILYSLKETKHKLHNNTVVGSCISSLADGHVTFGKVWLKMGLNLLQLIDIGNKTSIETHIPYTCDVHVSYTVLKI